MMNNQSTDARRRIRVLALAPALVLAVLATNIPCVASTLSAATTTTLVSEDGSKGSNNSATPQEQLQQLRPGVVELNNNGGTNIELTLASIPKGFSVQSAKFVIQGKAEYVCTKMSNSITEDGTLHIKLHIDEIINEDVPMFAVYLQTTLGQIVVPILRDNKAE